MARRAGRGLANAESQLRAHALAKPGATEHFPWGERAIKVNGKVFLFMSAGDDELSLSTKLPESAPVALLLPFATPTGYGLGKAGWVSARFGPGEPPPLDMLCAWIDESYLAIAPAKLAALARHGTGTATKARKPAATTKARASQPRATQAARKPASASAPAARKPASRKPDSASTRAARKPTSAARKPASAARKPTSTSLRRRARARTDLGATRTAP